MTSKFEQHPKLTLFIILSLTFLVLLIGFEKILGARLAGGNSNEQVRHIRLREHSPLLQQTLTPSAGELQNTDSLENKTFSFSTNKNGFINPSQLHEEPDVTIAFIGGSTTESMFVDGDKRFPHLTGKLLEKNGRTVNTINSGISGNDSLHSINIFLNKIMFDKPDIAIMMHNINDLSVLLYEKTYWNNNFYRSPLLEEDRSIKSFVKQLIPNTYELLYRLKADVSGHTDEFADVRGRELKINHKKILEMFAANLNIFINIAKAKNIKPVLMTQANRFTEKPDKVIHDNWAAVKALGVSYESYRELYMAMNQTIRKVAHENDILLIDLAKEVPQTKQYMYDPVHLNNIGSEFVSGVIAKHLENILN